MPRCPRWAAPSAARITRPCCTRWTRSRSCCRKTPSFARQSTDLSRASPCDPPHSPRSPQPSRSQRPPERSAAIGAYGEFAPSTPLGSCSDYEVVSVSLLKQNTGVTSMEVVLNRDAFLKGLQMVQNIVEPRQTLPILANVLLETDGEAVRLTATDLEVGARVAGPARVSGKRSITLSARTGTYIGKERPAYDLSLGVQDNSAIKK